MIIHPNLLAPISSPSHIREGFGKPFPNLFTYPRVFGKTKGEIWVEKGDQCKGHPSPMVTPSVPWVWVWTAIERFLSKVFSNCLNERTSKSAALDVETFWTKNYLKCSDQSSFLGIYTKSIFYWIHGHCMMENGTATAAWYILATLSSPESCHDSVSGSQARIEVRRLA